MRANHIHTRRQKKKRGGGDVKGRIASGKELERKEEGTSLESERGL